MGTLPDHIRFRFAPHATSGFAWVAAALLSLAFAWVLLASSPASAFADECPAGGLHDYEVTILQQATEDTEGLERLVCSKCGATTTRIIPSTGHIWSDWYVDTPATCISQGIEARVCTRYPDNPHYEYRLVPALSATGQHDYQETARTDPTCTEGGSVTYTCSICGEGYTEALPALGHEWGEWVVVREPTATEEGLRQRVCVRDATHVEEEAIPVAATADVGADSSSADEETAPPVKDFFTAGPNIIDAVIVGADMVLLIVLAILLVPLAAQSAWLKCKKAELRGQGKKENAE